MSGALLLPTLSAAAAAAFVAGLRATCDRRFISYDPSRDQHYDFAGSGGTAVNVAIDGSGFRWPEVADTWDTALLSLTIEGSLSGRFADPWIEAGVEGETTRQYFERGASGRRLVNLSALRKAAVRPGVAVALCGRHLRWASQSAQLRLFATPLPPRPRVLVLAPHPDDAEIAAFGLYSRSDAFIATITAGDYAGFYFERGQRAEAGCASPAQRARVWDSITVPFFGGVPPDRCVNLGYVDSSLGQLFEERGRPSSNGSRDLAEIRNVNLSSLMPPAPEVASWATLVGDLAHLCREIRPDVVVLPHPLLDDHPDHVFTTLAACDALAATKLDGGRLLLYVTHSPQSSLYPFGCADGAIAPPPHFGEPAPFRAVLSAPLAAETQELKFLALEAMHDLHTSGG